MTTVNDLLKITAFENAVVVTTGEKGLFKQVKTITIAEVPDAADYLEGGEVVCTSGFFLSNKTDSEVVEWLESLIKKEAVALVIKISRFIDELSDEVKLIANQNDFPIINLPNDIKWPSLIEGSLNLINNKNVLQLQQAQKIQGELTQLVLSGSDISKISQTFSNLVGNPIIVEDGRLNLISSAIPTFSKKRECSEKYIQIRNNKKFKKQIMNTNFYQQILNRHTSEILQKTLPETSAVNTITIPIIANQTIYGFLTLIEVEREFLTTDIVSLENGANAISLQLMNMEKNNHNEDQNVLQKLMNGYLFPSTLENPSIATVDWLSPMMVVLIQSDIEAVDEGVFVINHPKDKFENIIRENISKSIGKCFIAYENNIFTMLVSLQGFEKKEALFEIEKIFEECRNKLCQQFDSQEIRIAIGGIYSSRAKFKKSYTDAKNTLEIMRIIPEIGSVASFEFTGIYRLIHKIGDYNFLKSFKEDYLFDLAEHDRINNDILCDTLQAYLRVGGNVTKTAKKCLFILTR